MTTLQLKKGLYNSLDELLKNNKLEIWRLQECSHCITDVQVIKKLERKTGQMIKANIRNQITVI